MEHQVADYREKRLLFLHIRESITKPVHLRGKSIEETFIRSGGTTRKASRQDVGNLLLNSKTPRWEELHASVLLTGSEVVARLDFLPVFEALDRKIPSGQNEVLAWAVAEGFLEKQTEDGFYITNLGAMATSRNLGEFPQLARKAVRVLIYNGKDKSSIRLEKEGLKGYAIGFIGLLDFVMSHLPQSEVIEKALRQKRTLYPEIALRELIANALIHQDFTITGTGPLIEIFSDRIVISNPGGLLPSKRLDRLIGTQPESRNEALARAFRRYKICEELGSGLIKAGQAAELYGLPPIKFETGDNYFRVTLFAPRAYAAMSQRERLDACYQHAVLRFLAGETMTNKTLRERLKMPDKHRSMVSVILQQAAEESLIKPANPDNKSKKFTEYVPFWA
ncbi:ATP-binding protein [Aerolutibacter ruishenii]|uniref:Putative HTH transcriptional regulator n=1 Tax=Aerolutibacter ruishenii TaxID=686800 RepID=A0A562LDN3_9GAMM|nr:ATP-binding protein [Lysobacter ruishenii]TWI05728.1 putative HTH transcriptional regulator [Lysobacter ruishenii]